jgi:hypothetical protein
MKIFPILFALGLPLSAAQIAQFNPGGVKPTATPYAFTVGAAPLNPTNVAFPVGSGLNPTGTHSFSIAVTTNIFPTNSTGTPAWALTGAIPGIPSGTTIAAANLNPAFFPLLGAAGPLDVFAFKGGVGAIVNIYLNFANLPGGFLPAGSTIAYTDVDFGETAVLVGNVAWFNNSTIVPIDVTNGVVTGTGEADTTLSDYTTFSGSGTSLNLTGSALATDSPGIIIPTTANLTSLTITLKRKMKRSSERGK